MVKGNEGIHPLEHQTMGTVQQPVRVGHGQADVNQRYTVYTLYIYSVYRMHPMCYRIVQRARSARSAGLYRLISTLFCALDSPKRKRSYNISSRRVVYAAAAAVYMYTQRKRETECKRKIMSPWYRDTQHTEYEPIHSLADGQFEYKSNTVKESEMKPTDIIQTRRNRDGTSDRLTAIGRWFFRII